jgi:hypothetical protein
VPGSKGVPQAYETQGQKQSAGSGQSSPVEAAKATFSTFTNPTPGAPAGGTLVDSLSPEQQAAVLAQEQHIRVIAGRRYMIRYAAPVQELPL